MDTAVVVLSVILGLAFLAAGSGHALLAEGASAQLREQGMADRNIRLIGLAELAGGAGVLVGLALAPLGIAAAVGLVLLMAGAVAFHVRWHALGVAVMPAATLGVLALSVLVLRILTL